MAKHVGDLFDYEDEKPGGRAIDGVIPYWIAIPTTSGTGSEVGRSAVVSDETTHRKKIIFSPRLMAQAVFADPELTVGLPGPMTAATGMDAVTHLVEAYLAKGFNPLCDGIALEGLRLAGANLRRVMQAPDDVEARGGMLMASMMGAIAFQKGLGLTHSVAHALGTVADMHHGLANGIMIDHALAHNRDGAKERFADMARVLRVPNASADAFFEWLRELKKDIGIPADLRETSVKASQIPDLVEVAIQDGCHANNPVGCTREDFQRIFEQALHVAPSA
jgi:alcohol dehydrogenase class IV